MQSKSMSRSSRAGETVAFFKTVVFYIRKSTFLVSGRLRVPLGHHFATPPPLPPAPASSIFQAMWTKMGFGHNLQHMAPFGIPTSGFCMVFQYGSLVCSTPTPGPIWDPRIWIWVPAGLGTFFFPKNGGPENMILWRKWSPMRFEGDLCEGIGF